MSDVNLMAEKVTKGSHTPGPWSVTTCMDYWVEHAQPLTDGDDGFKGVAHCGDHTWPNAYAKQREWEANSRLIAAAPDLLEVVRDIHTMDCFYSGCTCAPDCGCIVARAQRAIAKAEGRS